MDKASKRERSAAAALLGRAGADVLNKNMTPQQRSASAKKAAAARWKGHTYSKNDAAVAQRRRRAARRRAA